MIPEKTPAGADAVKRWQPTPMMFYGVAAVAAILLIWAISGSVSASGARAANADLKASTDKTLASTKADYEGRLKESTKAGLQQTAEGVAASLAPFVALQGQVPEITSRSLQGAVRNLVQNRNLRFVAITDPSGQVVAASDLTLVGRPMRAPQGMNTATAQIGTDQPRGSVVLGVR